MGMSMAVILSKDELYRRKNSPGGGTGVLDPEVMFSDEAVTFPINNQVERFFRETNNILEGSTILFSISANYLNLRLKEAIGMCLWEVRPPL
jgi:hypothetical protein